MAQPDFPLLSLIVFLPLLGALALLLFRDTRPKAIRRWALGVSAVELALSLWLLLAWQSGDGVQFADGPAAWIPELGIGYHLGVDGISLFLVLLSTFLWPLAVLASWDRIVEREKGYYFFLLLLETGCLGVFTALDTALFYVFWEAVLVPMYFLIGGWGGERRVYATTKFILYTMAGSALMLVAVLAGYALAGSFSLEALAAVDLTHRQQTWLFLAFGLAFAVKAPLFPFHTWLPDAYGESPAPVTALLAGVLSKMGVYGFLRFCLPLFPDAVATFAPAIAVLAMIGVVYAALNALVQKSVKRVIAYSGVGHISLILLGVFVVNVEAVGGAVLQMINHGINVALLFLLAGALKRRTGRDEIAALGGLWKIVPWLGTLMLVAVFASVGLPGTNGFVGEMALLVGIFQANRAYAVIGATGLILGAWYMLNLYRNVMLGPPPRPGETAPELQDLSGREAVVLLPLAVLIFMVGILPNLLLARMTPAVESLVEQARVTQVDVAAK
jgi:NADH-quinone oxidoreductase subunit M